nr:PEP/pyruvate-binding domain-containing protein [Lachnospiraceae bacterium]
ILNTTQLFFDVYSDSKTVYVRPEKLWNRNSATMFLPHTYDPETGQFRPILDGVRSSRFYQTLGQAQRSAEEQYSDSWDRYFNRVKLLRENGIDITDDCAQMCDIMMTRDDKMRRMVKKHFTPEDYFAVRDHMVGTGMIGGKACGMLLARAIIRNKEPDISEVLEPHDSFYVGSDLYYTYIVDNNLWDTRIRQRSEDGYFELAKEFADKIMEGTFSEAMRDQFVRIIEYYGQDPYIIRSSSILEDGFGNAFAGKYESVFCVNRGSLEERLDEFEHAIKIVYASSMSLSALDYRKRRGLDKRDEQMALLIQRVSGSYYGSRYMPCAAGVGYSYSPYRVMKDSDPTAGMLRLVMGLGTSAVDRTEGSYPRIVNLDMPEKTSYSSSADKHKFSQGKAEVIDMTEHGLKRLSLDEIQADIPAYLDRILLEHDFDTERRLRETGRDRDVKFISCKGLVANKTLMEQMRRLLHCIQDEYDYPVDTEFTINISESGEYSVDLLQCRPLQVQKTSSGTVIPPDIPKERILLESTGSSMGMSKTTTLDIIVYVDPVKYYNMPYKDKDLVAKLIGKINWHYRGQGRHMMLIVPGRIGTSSPELGVPTGFSDISEYEIICETEERNAGYNPELSYGSHIFQDLVEAQILYTAVFCSEKTIQFSPEKLQSSKDIVSELNPPEAVKDIVHVYDVSSRSCEVYNDVANEHLVITC